MEDGLAKLQEFLDYRGVPTALLVIAGAWLVIQLGSGFADALGERFSRRRLLFKQITAVGRFAVVLLAAWLAIDSVVVLTDEALLALGGSLAVAVGFALKDLVASLMAGLILLFDRPFRVGDRIELDGKYGEVTEIGLRAVRLVTLDDNLVSIPNNLFLSTAVASANAGALDQMCVYDFYVGCREDVAAAKRIVYESAAASRFVFLEKPIVVVVREGPLAGAMGRFAVRITLKAYVFDGRYETAFGTDLTERVHRAFRRSGIRSAGEIEEHRLGLPGVVPSAMS